MSFGNLVITWSAYGAIIGLGLQEKALLPAIIFSYGLQIPLAWLLVFIYSFGITGLIIAFNLGMFGMLISYLIIVLRTDW